MSRSLGALTSRHRSQNPLAPRRDPRGHGILPRHKQGVTLPLRVSYEWRNHGPNPRQPQPGVYATHPGHRRPDLRARMQEEESILRGQLEILALRLDERLWREDNDQ